jgi:hypothetical protein
MSGMPLETPQRHTAFARSYGTRSMLSPRIQALGRTMEVALGGTSSHDFPSAWYTSSAVTKLKSSPWFTGGDGRDTGARDSDAPSNFRIQQPALRAAADPAR